MDDGILTLLAAALCGAAFVQSMRRKQYVWAAITFTFATLDCASILLASYVSSTP